MKFYIYIENRMVAEVSGMDFAYEVYRKTCELADLLCTTASLVDGESGEVVAYSDDFDDYDHDYEPEDNEIGFDPYSGCYTYDC